MDMAWDTLGLSSTTSPSGRQLADFYSHPVWILNGFFSASDPQSCAHRDAIAKAILDLPVSNIADFGGGMGELAIRMARSNPNYEISIIEPYPSNIGRYRVSQYANISYVAILNGPYDLVIAQDVLEHVDDPVGLAAQLSNATKIGGYLIFANCFYPVIKCHLPSSFHLRDTFNWVVKEAGLEFIGNVAGAEHAGIFKKVGKVHVSSLRGREYYSKVLSFAKNHARSLRKQAKDLISR
jgi:2-polyprenyl-6-hydroxyphenyl methylase/3-demethylubiquinone-9 3-methyltransferase